MYKSYQYNHKKEGSKFSLLAEKSCNKLFAQEPSSNTSITSAGSPELIIKIAKGTAITKAIVKAIAYKPVVKAT